MLRVTLWDQDILELIPDSPDDFDHSDLINDCTFELDEPTLKQRALTCLGSGIVELTIEPHVAP